MSPAGIPMFYGSEDPETALAELRLASLTRLATVGAWTTARPLRFLDLVDVDVPSLFDMVGKSQRRWRLFLKAFADDVSLPASPSGAAVDYVPTQVFTEYVRQVLGGSDPVRGIRYRSAMRPQSVSWVLFVDAGGRTEGAPGWEAHPGHWLALEASSVRRFQAEASWTELE
ncbi:MAG: RES family NAD+ phosphorylase [Acidimicrobiales bacterium]